MPAPQIAASASSRRSGADVAARALELGKAGAGAPASVTELVALAGPDGRGLVEAHFLLVQRLHRRSDDFAATAALRLVSAAHHDVRWQDSPPPEPGRKRPRPGRGRRRSPRVATDS